MSSRLEHANVTVRDLPRTLRLLQVALPDWRVRGRGEMTWIDRTIEWVHFGSDEDYIALQSEGQGAALPWESHTVGTKHLGFIVDDARAVVARLAEAGFPLDHWGTVDDVRVSAYVMDEGSVQFEFVSYHTADLQQRLTYAATF